MTYLSPENSLAIMKGSSHTIDLEVRGPDGKVLDITSAKLFFSVKAAITDTAFVIRKTSTSASEIEITEPRSGKASIYLDPSDTAHLSPGFYVYDVWVVLLSGRRYSVVGPSELEVQASVTAIPV